MLFVGPGRGRLRPEVGVNRRLRHDKDTPLHRPHMVFRDYLARDARCKALRESRDVSAAADLWLFFVVQSARILPVSSRGSLLNESNVLPRGGVQLTETRPKNWTKEKTYFTPITGRIFQHSEFVWFRIFFVKSRNTIIHLRVSPQL